MYKLAELTRLKAECAEHSCRPSAPDLGSSVVRKNRKTWDAAQVRADGSASSRQIGGAVYSPAKDLAGARRCSEVWPATWRRARGPRRRGQRLAAAYSPPRCSPSVAQRLWGGHVVDSSGCRTFAHGEAVAPTLRPLLLGLRAGSHLWVKVVSSHRKRRYTVQPSRQDSPLTSGASSTSLQAWSLAST